MIAVKLMGGLGNQMFQYAAGKRLAIHHKTKLVLDISHYNNQPEEEVPRQYELNCFNIREHIIDQSLEEGGLKRLFRSVDFNIIRESHFSFDEQVLNAADNTLLIGYWQSEKYFADISDQIRKDYIFKNPLSTPKQKLAGRIKTSDQSVSVQVRRGDYISHAHSSRFHGALPLSYYSKATSVLTKAIKQPHFFVISDDTEWCRQNLKFNYETTYVDHIAGSGQEDMHLTSLCRHNIIANSTFSWWGAWLNKNSEKLVIAPKQWFKDPKAETPDVVPADWTRV